MRDNHTSSSDKTTHKLSVVIELIVCLSNCYVVISYRYGKAFLY